MLVGVMSNGNRFHGLMYFDIVLRYQKQLKNQFYLEFDNIPWWLDCLLLKSRLSAFCSVW